MTRQMAKYSGNHMIIVIVSLFYLLVSLSKSLIFSKISLLCPIYYKSTKKVKFIWSSYYSYPTDSKNPENIVELDEKEEIRFYCLNVIDF